MIKGGVAGVGRDGVAKLFALWGAPNKQVWVNNSSKQGQSVLQGRETQSIVSTCISPGCSHKTERQGVQDMS